MSLDLSVVIPVWKSTESLGLLTQRLAAVLDDERLTFEIIFVDDGSPAPTWDVIQQLTTQYPAVRGIRLMRNFGQHNATLCGLRHSRGQWVATLDDDLQHPPEELPKLLTAARTERFDVLYGHYAKKQHPHLRNLGSKAIGWLFQRAHHMPTPPTSFRLIRREVVDCLVQQRSPRPIIDAALVWSTQAIGRVTVEHAPSTNRRSRYSPLQLANFLLGVLLSTPTLLVWPMATAAALALAASMAAAVAAVWLPSAALAAPCVTLGCTGLVLLAGAAILLSAELPLSQLNGKPAYVTRELVNCSESQADPLDGVSIAHPPQREAG